MDDILHITVMRGDSGYLFAKCAEYHGFLVAQPTLADVMADIPQVLSGLIARGANIPSMNGVTLPEPNTEVDIPVAL